ncbi:MAG: phosphatase PAP2 family protein, partial [Methanobacteriota archaeon]
MSTPMGNDASRTRKTFTTSFMGLVVLIVIGLLSASLFNPRSAADSMSKRGQIEPLAGTWKTWVLESGDQLRLPEPPDKKASKNEVKALKELAQQRDAAALDRIAYWNTGAPVYRWNRIAVEEALGRNMNTLAANRALALLNAGIYDATIAAWDSKYAYDRPRPSDLDGSLTTVLSNPRSPSYPSEHAVAAGTASEILAYLFPDKADNFRAMAEEAGEAFLLAGTQYPSDVEAGIALGQQVGAMVVERGMADGSDAVWQGTVPPGPGTWNGQNPLLPLAGNWDTYVLESGDEFRPAPPLEYDSPEKAAEMEVLKTFERTPKSNAHAFFWEYGGGGTRNYVFWNEHLSRLTLEHKMDDNAPRAARVFAVESITVYDATVACWDAKYAFWAIRPFQLDPTFQPLFATPNHPSYPAAHATLSTAAAEAIAYLFPNEADYVRAQAQEAADSRVWAGIHYPSDVAVGTT